MPHRRPDVRGQPAARPRHHRQSDGSQIAAIARGGRTEVVRASADLAAAAARIAEELNSQYVLGYTSTHGADGRYHSIRVRAAGGEYSVRARNGYVAMPIQHRKRSPD